MSREGGRSCGCDPKANHVCAQHLKHVDESETEIAGAFTYPHGRREPMIVVVTGPDDEGEFGIMGSGGEWSILPRFVVEDLITELERRLAERKDE